MFFNGRLTPAHQYARSGQTSEAPNCAAYREQETFPQHIG
jgi:hypothetical protein